MDGATQRRAKQFIADSPDGSAVRLLREFDRDTASTFFSLGCSAGPSSSSTTASTTARSCFDGEAFREAVKQSFKGNGKVTSGDAADVVEKIEPLSDTKQARAADLVDRASGEGGAEFLADASSTTIKDVLSSTVDGVEDTLQKKVRASLAQSYSRNYYTLSTDDSWADKLYNVDDSTEVAGEIARDIDTLNSGNGIDGEVKGLARTLASDDDGGSGAYLDDLPDPDASDNPNYDPASPVKGAALELRTARQAAHDLDPGEKVRMSAAPDVNFDLDSDQIEDVDEKVYADSENSLDEEDVLTSNPEFDAVQVVTDEDGGTQLAYLESKNTGGIPSTPKVREQAARFFATQVAKGADIEDLEVTFVTRSEEVATALNKRIDGDWFTARASSTSDG
ncbi:hypothetical protein ACFQJ7_17165 [Halovenus rubra]|uniref:Uncharacterized protein n=2 Tax=Halovenus rubra TaxID=869890 RepID=A0ACC7DY76_9EURY|nr:hypothetical protein [Halovenus rubra]